MKNPLLVIFIGVPGSGKTYFGSRLAERIDAVRLNSDAMRLAIFDSLEVIEKTYKSPQRRMLNDHTFGAMDYATKQVLERGTSVVYEAIQRTKADRIHMEELAAQCDARLVLVSMVTDLETAISRVQQREVANDSRKFTDEQARQAVEHFSEHLEPLERKDYVVEIDGTMPFEDQYKAFQAFLA